MAKKMLALGLPLSVKKKRKFDNVSKGKKMWLT